MQQKHGVFKVSELSIVEEATHEEILVGDFVRLASGSPVGIVTDRLGDQAAVTILGADAIDLVLPWVCFRRAFARHV